MEPVTYCTNIHPGESWADIRDTVFAFVPSVRAAVAPGEAFPVGLRISGQASRELDAATVRCFGEALTAKGLYVRTVNGFPYGRFHNTPVKESVYLPDWRDPERLAYTIRLAEALAAWLPEGGVGSISTVPLGFRRGFPETDLPLAFGHLRRALEHLAGIASDTGRLIRLAVEAEPGCLIETTPEMVTFFERLDAPSDLMRHLAVCYDCCHQALQYEDPVCSLGLLADHGIPVGHVQVSSALHLEGDDLSRLARFVEPVYLHQAVACRDDGGLVRFDDLPEALRARVAGVVSWRVHFHLPVFVATLPDCGTTQPFLQTALPLFAPDIPLEVETYTWSVLPPELKMDGLTQSISREITWVEGVRRTAGS